MLLNFRHSSTHSGDRQDAGATLNSSQNHSGGFYIFEKHVKISEVDCLNCVPWRCWCWELSLCFAWLLYATSARCFFY